MNRPCCCTPITSTDSKTHGLGHIDHAEGDGQRNGAEGLRDRQQRAHVAQFGERRELGRRQDAARRRVAGARAARAGARASASGRRSSRNSSPRAGVPCMARLSRCFGIARRVPIGAQTRWPAGCGLRNEKAPRQCLGAAPAVRASRVISRLIVVVKPSVIRSRRRRQPVATGAVHERQRRARRLLADTGLAPVAHAVGERRVQPVQLLGGERHRHVVGGVDRLQLALQDVLRQRAPGHLARRGVLGQMRIGVAQRHVGDRRGEVDVARQVAQVERERGRVRGLGGDHLRLRAHRVEGLLRRARQQRGEPGVHRQERLRRHRGHLRGGCGQQPGAIAPDDLVAVVAVVVRLDAGAFGEGAPDVVDAERPIRRLPSSKPRESMIGSLPRFLPLDTMPAR